MTVTQTTLTLPENLHIRGLEMPWNRVLANSAEPAGAARALGPWHPQEFQAECVEAVVEVARRRAVLLRGGRLARGVRASDDVDRPGFVGTGVEPLDR